MNTYKVYAMVDASGRITAINSNAFLPNVEGWTEIDAGMGDKYHHAQNNYLPGPLMDRQGICQYKLADGKAVLRTQAEMDADAAALPAQAPTEMEQLKEWQADVEAALIELASMAVREE
nr:MAG TPA: hypothetical protein [Caudoviricetes sp.]